MPFWRRVTEFRAKFCTPWVTQISTLKNALKNFALFSDENLSDRVVYDTTLVPRMSTLTDDFGTVSYGNSAKIDVSTVTQGADSVHSENLNDILLSESNFFRPKLEPLPLNLNSSSGLRFLFDRFLRFQQKRLYWRTHRLHRPDYMELDLRRYKK